MKVFAKFLFFVSMAVMAVSVVVAGDGSAFSLDGVFGDHMVLQRNRPIRLSGSGAPGLMVEVSLAGRDAQTFVDGNGRWLVEMPAMEAGGPYRLSVVTRSGVGRVAITKVRLEDVVVGEVWLASGQSNMEFWVLGDDLEKSPFYHLPDGEAAAALKDGDLRIFYVPKAVNIDRPCVNPPAGACWKRAETREANGRCSAVAYWFGKELRRRLGNVPVGVISCSWGGTRIESWMSDSWFERNGTTDEHRLIECAVKSPHDGDQLARNRAEDLRLRRARLLSWLEKFGASDPSMTEQARANWARPDLDVADWTRGPRAQMKGLSRPGVAWYRFNVMVPESWAGPIHVHFDGINDCDETFWDGESIGKTGIDVPEYWKVPRNYRVEHVTSGCHVVTVRAQDHFLSGWICPGMYIENLATGERVPFGTGDWCERIEFTADLEKIGVRPPDADGNTVEPRFFESTPTTLFNAMVSPISSMNIGGVIWYQGCSNRHEPDRYRVLQRGIVDCWRETFRDARMPFLITQLSSFSVQTPSNRLPDDFWKSEVEPPSDSAFGMFRLVQDEMRNYPSVGVVCTMDIGDHSDIHFPNKKEVGRRLALEAMRVAFDDSGVLPGPRGVNALMRGNDAIVTFSDVGTGLVLSDGGTTFGPHLFAVAGPDGIYHWASGELLVDGTVKVSSSAVSQPTRIRYGVSDYPPEVRFVRQEDKVPVFPFELNVD